MKSSAVDFWILLAPSLGALIFAVAGYINARKAAIIGVANREKLETVEKQMDGHLSRLSEQNDATQKALGIAEGKAEGAQEDKAEKKLDLAQASDKAKAIVALAAAEALKIIQKAKDQVEPKA